MGSTIKTWGKSLSSSFAQDRNFVVSRLGEVIKLESSIPSRMKRIFTLNVKIDGPLKVKGCTLVIINYEASLNSKEKVKRGWASFFSPHHSSGG